MGLYTRYISGQLVCFGLAWCKPFVVYNGIALSIPRGLFWAIQTVTKDNSGTW